MITLQFELVTLTLDKDLEWADENDWHPVEQTAQRSVTGALLVSVQARIAGRPITLQPTDDQSAWITRALLDSLKGWASIPGRVMQLTIAGVARSVIFRHEDGAIDARPLVPFAQSDIAADDWYLTTLRFTEI